MLARWLFKEYVTTASMAPILTAVWPSPGSELTADTCAGKARLARQQSSGGHDAVRADTHAHQAVARRDLDVALVTPLLL